MFSKFVRVFVCLSVLWAIPVFAQNATTTGTVTLTTTLQTISVTAAFTGDANANNSISVQFQKHTGDTYHPAYTSYIDRRATVGGSTNTYAKTARLAIVGLASNTSYDVQVTWSDPDGVSGTNPITTTVSTLTSAPPTGSGTIRSITSNATQTSVLATPPSPGDTVTWSALGGGYNPVTLSASGTSGAWIIYDGGGVATINGTGTNQNILVSCNYCIIRNFILGASDFSAIVVSASQSNIIINGNTIQGFSTLCANGPTTTHYGDSGIKIGSSNSSIFVLSNSITGSTNLSGCLQSPSYSGPGTGISWTTVTTLVVNGNTVVGNGLRDAISQDDSDMVTTDVDLTGNTVSGYLDDGIETKGGNVNSRVWSNNINGTLANSCVAANSNYLGATPPTVVAFGPLYIFRNICYVNGVGTGGNAYKMVASGQATIQSSPTYVFHNSMDTHNVSSGQWDGYVMNVGMIISAMNNILSTGGSAIDYGTGTFDYNIYRSTGGSSFTFDWNNGTSYTAFSDFTSGTGNEAHGLSANPLFLDTSLHINTTSPAYNAGVVIPNFNDAASAWPYIGTAPDIGAYELNPGPYRFRKFKIPDLMATVSVIAWGLSKTRKERVV
jgi:hypothetical protein